MRTWGAVLLSLRCPVLKCKPWIRCWHRSPAANGIKHTGQQALQHINTHHVANHVPKDSGCDFAPLNVESAIWYTLKTTQITDSSLPTLPKKPPCTASSTGRCDRGQHVDLFGEVRHATTNVHNNVVLVHTHTRICFGDLFQGLKHILTCTNHGWCWQHLLEPIKGLQTSKGRWRGTNHIIKG